MGTENYVQSRKRCKVCKKNLATFRRIGKSGERQYRSKCYGCIWRAKSPEQRRKRNLSWTVGKRPWLRFRKDRCEFCGFIPVHLCQLDVDHKDGNKKNNEQANLQTLCANCHRLKTQLNQDWK